MVNVGSALSTTEPDEDDGWDDDESFINDLVGRGPYNAEPLDPAQLPVDRKERLKAIETALMDAEVTRSKSVAWSKLRWTIETGVALGVLVGEDLYQEDEEFNTLELYAEHRLHMARGYVYELASDAERLLKIAPLSEISDKPFNPSQAKVLAPLMEPEETEVGKTKAELVVADVEAAGQKRTAAALRKAAAARGYVVTNPAPPAPRRPASDDRIEDAEVIETDGTRAVEALHGLLQQQKDVYDGIGGGVLATALEAEPGASEELLREFLQYVSRTEHRIRTAMKSSEPDGS